MPRRSAGRGRGPPAGPRIGDTAARRWIRAPAATDRRRHADERADPDRAPGAELLTQRQMPLLRSARPGCALGERPAPPNRLAASAAAPSWLPGRGSASFPGVSLDRGCGAAVCYASGRRKEPRARLRTGRSMSSFLAKDFFGKLVVTDAWRGRFSPHGETRHRTLRAGRHLTVRAGGWPGGRRGRRSPGRSCRRPLPC